MRLNMGTKSYFVEFFPPTKFNYVNKNFRARANDMNYETMGRMCRRSCLGIGFPHDKKKFHHTTSKLQIKHAKIPVLSALSTECFLLFDGPEFGGWAPIPSIPLIEYEFRGIWTLLSIFILTSVAPFATSSLVGLILSPLLIRFRTILLMELTLGTLSVVQTPSLKSRSRISQANMVGFARL